MNIILNNNSITVPQQRNGHRSVDAEIRIANKILKPKTVKVTLFCFLIRTLYNVSFTSIIQQRYTSTTTVLAGAFVGGGRV